MDINIKNITGVLIVIAISVALFASMLVPIVADATTDSRVNVGNGLAMIDESETYEISYTSAAQTVNGIQSELISNARNVIFSTDTITAIWDSSANKVAIEQWNGTAAAHLTNLDSITATISNNSITYTAGSNSATISYADWGFVAQNGGDWAFTSLYNGGNIYYAAIDEVYSSYYTYTSGYFYALHGKEVSVNGSAIPEAQVTFTQRDEVGNLDYSTIKYANTSDIQFTFATDKTCNVFNAIVKAQAVAEKSGSEYTLISIIPLLVLAGLTVGVIGAVIGRRD